MPRAVVRHGERVAVGADRFVSAARAVVENGVLKQGRFAVEYGRGKFELFDNESELEFIVLCIVVKAVVCP